LIAALPVRARQSADDLARLCWTAIEARLALVHWPHDDPLLRADLRRLRALSAALVGWRRVSSPGAIRQIRDGLAEWRIKDFLTAKPDRPALLEQLPPAMGATERWSI
jgi:DNA mismatch repair protein MutS